MWYSILRHYYNKLILFYDNIIQLYNSEAKPNSLQLMKTVSLFCIVDSLLRIDVIQHRIKNKNIQEFNCMLTTLNVV